MSSPFRLKPIAFQLKKLSAAVALATLFSNAVAAGWGDLRVQSSLGQPLRAEIELVSASRQDDGPLTVKLAPFDTYRQANIEFNPVLTSLRFAVEQRGNRQFVRVTSTQPLNEPFVDMLLELSSSNGRVVREYVFLLDPPGLDGGMQTAVAAPVSDVAGLPASAAAPAANKPSAQAEPQAARQPKRAPAPPRKTTAKAAHNKTASAAPPSASTPRLTLSGVTAVSATDDKAGVVVLEDYATMEKAVAEANARVKALEQKVADLQKLLEVTNSLLAEMQKQNELIRAAAQPAASPVAASAQAAQTAVPTLTETNPAEATPGETPAASAPAAAPAPAAVPAPAPAASKPVAPPASDDSDSYLLPGAALLVSLLGAAGIYINRRRNAKKPLETRLYDDAQRDTSAAAAGAADAAATALAAGILLPAGLGHSHDVDPLAEADVYIAYGRDVQAEGILKEALRKQPELHPARVKLLSIYAGRKDLQSFALLANELHGMTAGDGEDWAQAAELGREIDPANPLYALPQPAPADTLPEPELVLERVEDAAPVFAAEEPATFATPAGLVATQEDVPLPDLTPTAEVTPVALETAADDADFDLDGMAADAPALAVPPVVEETRESGPGPIDFDFLKPVDTQETPEILAISGETSASVPELPAAALGDTKTDGNLLDFDFLKPEPVEETAAAGVPEIPAAIFAVPESKPEEALLDFDFLKPEAPNGAPSQEDAIKRSV